MSDPYPPALLDALDRAVRRLRRRIRRAAPALAPPTLGWMRAIAGESSAVRYFTHHRAFPMLLLPWWLERRITAADQQGRFRDDLVYATITGYYVVRLLDDVMDGDVPPPAAIPAVIPLHTEFLRTFQRHFPAHHAFWTVLESTSAASAELASHDATLDEVSLGEFRAISGRKVIGAKIPLAAVCHRFERVDLLESWSTFAELLGCWHQMLNDMVGWSVDLARGRWTYFLSEGRRRTGSGAAVAGWVVDQGLAWGFAELDAWMDELLAAGARLESPEVVAYLRARRAAVDEEWHALQPSVNAMRRLAATLR